MNSRTRNILIIVGVLVVIAAVFAVVWLQVNPGSTSGGAIACNGNSISRSSTCTNCNLSNCKLNSANLANANFSGSDFTNTQLPGATLKGVNFGNAKLYYTNLNGATWDAGTNFVGTQFCKAIWFDGTIKTTDGVTCP